MTKGFLLMSILAYAFCMCTMYLCVKCVSMREKHKKTIKTMQDNLEKLESELNYYRDQPVRNIIKVDHVKPEHMCIQTSVDQIEGIDPEDFIAVAIKHELVGKIYDYCKENGCIKTEYDPRFNQTLVRLDIFISKGA